MNQFNFANIFVVLASHKLLKVVSFKLKKFFVFSIINDQHLIGLLFNLFLQIDIVVGCEHKILTKVSWKNDVHDVYLFNYDTVWLEFDLKLCHHLTSKLSFDISYSAYFNLFCEVTDFFVHFFLEQFFKSVWTEIVEELLYVFMLSFFGLANVEVDTNIHGDSYVIFGWNVSDWASKSNCVFGYHHGNSLVVAVAKSASRRHQLISLFAPNLFKNEHTIWNIKLWYATSSILHDNHDWNSS